jgi:L-asparagine oxygenase
MLKDKGIFLHGSVGIGFVPKTPATPFASSIKEQSSKESTRTLLHYAHQLGYPISYAQEQNGQLIQNILPVHKTEAQQISTSSKVELALHTETAFHPYKPDYILLLCLRGDDKAATTYANVNDIIELLSDEVIKSLKQPWYRTAVDDSFRTQGEPQKEFIMPILSEVDGKMTITYDNFFMRGINTYASLALAELNYAIQKCTREIVLKTGDLLVIDNSTVIHGRKPFQARYDGTDRWVQRMLVRKQMPPDDQIDGNIITTKFG